MKLLFYISLFIFASCSKPKDYSYLNTDRREYIDIHVELVDEFYETGDWLPDSVMRTFWGRDTTNIPKPDTLYNSCVVKGMPNEIVKFEIVKIKNR